MQSGKTIVGIAILIILLAAGYVFLIEEGAQNDAVVDIASPEKPSQPEQIQPEILGRDEDSPVSKRKEHAAIVQQDEMLLDESSLPTGLPPEDMILDPDAEEIVYDTDAIPVNIGEYLDPDLENQLPSVSDVEEEVVNIGEYLDPDADPQTLPSDVEEIPQHIGPFIDVDGGELDSIVHPGLEETINIGEHIDPE